MQEEKKAQNVKLDLSCCVLLRKYNKIMKKIVRLTNSKYKFCNLF